MAMDARRAQRAERLLRFHPASALRGAALIEAAIAYKKLLSHDPAGFPGYLVFLVSGALVLV
ncbi:MAG TPA: hypothetical protein VME68_08410 [Acidobacteriaceae bacterium]|nr:hypothetical protein [Acidobacteriaceae bacterium]